MSVNFALQRFHQEGGLTGADEQAVLVRELGEPDRWQALELLADDPLHGVILQSLIEDYGIVSADLRGQFYGYFENGNLTGIALLGYQILFSGSAAARDYFAQKAGDLNTRGFVMFGRRDQVDDFLAHMVAAGREVREMRDFYFLVCEKPAHPLTRLQMQKAYAAHLDIIVEAHALLHAEATGVDPREADPEGFRRRVAKRIERGRTWVKIVDGKVVFKAELQSVTPTTIYLEGVWTHPDHRGSGVARECVLELTHRRLHDTQIISLVVEPHEEAAQHIYEYAGFQYTEDYRAVYLKPPEVKDPGQ